MKRTALLIVAGLALAAPVPASADFHAACVGTAVADVNMGHADGTFTYTGFVECGNATTIEITSLTLRRPDATQDAAAPASCGPCDSLQATGDDPAGASGTYRVQMTFRVRGAGQTFTTSRARDFTWDGTTLVPIGPPPPPPPALGLCDSSQPRSASVAYANETAPPLSHRWSGALVCAGVDEMLISELSVQRRTALGDGPVRRANVSGAHCVGCSTLSADGTGATEGPGTYRVTLRYAIRKGTDVRSGVAQRDFNSLGAGPILP